MPMRKGIPSLRRHRPSGQAVTTLGGNDYCGRWPEDLAEPPDEVRRLHDRLVARWLASGRVLPVDFRVSDLDRGPN